MPLRAWSVLLLLGLVLLIGCTSTSALPPRVQAIKDRNTIIIGTAITRPFEYRNEQGELVGMDVEIAKAIAQRIGVEIEWREMAFADLIPTVQEGKVDLVIAAMYITPARQELVDMSDGYIDTGLVVVTKAGEPLISNVEALAGKSIGVKKGSTGARFAQSLRDRGIAITIQEYTETPDSLEELSAGFVDAVLNDKVNSIEWIKTHPDLQVASDPLEPAQLGIAVRKGDTELLSFINRVLGEIRADGRLDQLYNQWVLGR